MSRIRRRISAVLAALIGVVVGSTIALSADQLFPGSSPPSPRTQRIETPERALVEGEVATTAPRRSRLLAWAPGGLPRSASKVVRSVRGIVDPTIVVAGTDWLIESRDADGAPLDRFAPGFGVPMDIAVVDPGAFARFLPPSEAGKVARLSSGEVLLSETSASLRRGGPGMELHFRDGRRLLVTGVVSDEAAGGYEALLGGAVPGSWRRTYPFLLARSKREQAREIMTERLERILPAGQVLRVRAQGETPFLRYGDAVLPEMLVKKNFGEFAARPDFQSGALQVSGRWVRTNIRTWEVPILGRVTCHRALVPQLTAALTEIEASGLAQEIDPSDYGGCYSPRFISGSPGGRLSHHAWGIAIDIDASENAFGTRPDQDRRVVEIFERYGFTWGGRWLIPDGMHFEWARFP